MLFMRSSFGDTTGTVSMVLATAISSSAVNDPKAILNPGVLIDP